ncbi:MAG: hypothetical protein OZSIB_2685 [Candidatus Ozemobacter sibiricus]|uniref:Putative restriction endonuclease domain-containing protein n=1 Tax=Candidatus Ozemobacter sibiricus TaxID=2268124 RepID=A0A367ZSH6_9BACT|nr:MAG: hypothetical protein OZSIB_2685 [Candidatus Ozemobacter sibiricus]
MNHPRIAPHKRYTYGDYLYWPEDERWELIDGEAFDMTPAPNVDHQYIVGRLYRFFDEFLEGKPCHAFVSPFDVRIPKGDEADEDIDTVVQPDVIVVCPPGHLDQRGLRGAPDLAIEVLSPSTASKDQIKKRRLYERCGVKEYWVVQPADRVVMVTRRAGPHGGFGRTEFYGDTDRIDVALFPGLTIDLARVFPPAPQPAPAPLSAAPSEARKPPPPAARSRRRKK